MPAASAEALTLAQVQAEAQEELPNLMFDLIAFQSGDDVDAVREEYVNEGEVYDCRRTSRRRGSCIAEVIDVETGAGCNAYVIIRQSSRIRGGITRTVRDDECWD